MAVYRIHHITRYRYDRPVKESINQLLVYPVADATQEVLEHHISITNEPEVFTFTDYWGNKTGSFSLLDAHKELVIDNKLVVRTLPVEMPQNINSDWKPLLKQEIDGQIHLLEFTQPDDIKHQDKINTILSEIHPEKEDLILLVEKCNEYIFLNFSYIKGITDIETTVDEILEHRSGVCQDFAHVLLQLLRTQGIPCRYVSGYICPNRNGLRGEGATHAWVEVFIPGQGWRGIDPTNNIWVNETHIKLAVGRNFKDCTPVKGTYKGPAIEVLTVYVSVGYEDGHVFEDMNDVQLQTQLSGEKVVPLSELEHQQQQQQ
jgi:transglutaminase-like putative cysteine protease